MVVDSSVSAPASDLSNRTLYDFHDNVDSSTYRVVFRYCLSVLFDILWSNVGAILVRCW